MCEAIDPITLVGRRVKHNCDDPNCELEGIVTRIIPVPSFSLRGEYSPYWIEVQWDGIGDVPQGYRQSVPPSRIELIENE